MGPKLYFCLYGFLLLLSGTMIGLFTNDVLTLEQQLEDLEVTNRCYKCCIENDLSCVASDVCNSRIDYSICGQPEDAGHSGKFLVERDAKIKKVIQGVLSNKPSQLFHGHKSKLLELNDLILRVPKPRAHLSAVGYSCRSQPQRTESHRHIEYQNKCWDDRPLINFAEVKEGMNYNKDTGVLRVPQAGKYYIYLHTTFYTTSLANNDTESRQCPLSHSVKRKNQRRNKPLKILMQSKEDVKCGYSTGSKHLWNGKDKHKKFQTFHSSGVYKLDEEDELMVFYKMPGHVRVAADHHDSYFGAFMI